MLNNWRKHEEHRAPELRDLPIDPFSSAASFDGWRDLDEPTACLPRTYEPLPVWKPKTWLLSEGWKTWLLSEGWKLYGLVATTEIPGRKLAFAD